MKISTKGQYALQMFLDLAEHRNEGFVALKDIAKRQGISKKYLEQIVILLNRSDLLLTNRGSQGGYKLSKPLSEYKVGDILRYTEGTLTPVECDSKEPEILRDGSEGMLIGLWQGLEKVIADYLDGISVQDIVDDYAKKAAEGRHEYYI
ncbi:AsnC family transcriptional regulator [Planctomycetales bacterium]|nr:AsnC family transcriptional regulator [Planctomycetales bacterium]GHT35230.1 AsnC family transcriptional regulator [Planctomycetales bacterium]